MARVYTGISPETLPDPSDKDFQPRLREMLDRIDYWARDASFGFQRIILGQSPDGSGDPLVIDPNALLDFLYLPGRTGGQTGYWSDDAAPFFTLDSGKASSLDAQAANNSAVLWRFQTSDAINAFSVAANGAVVINNPYTSYGAGGNPVMFTLQMDDFPGVSGDNDFFKIRTNSTDVLTVGYFGLTQWDMTINDVALVVDQLSGATADFMRFNDGSAPDNPRGSVTKLGFDSNGDIYGGSTGASTLNLFSDNLADSTTGSIRMTATPTVEIRSGLSGNTYVPYQFGISTTGACQLTLNNARISLGATSGGATGGFPSVIVDNSNAANASAATVLYKAIRKSTQTADLFECLDSDGTTLLSAFNSAGAYRLVTGAGSGNVLTSDANGVGSWASASSVIDVARTWSTLQKFPDDKILIGGSADITKALIWELDGATTAKTLTLISSHTDNRSITYPNATTTLAGLAVAQTFTKAQTITPDSDATGLTVNAITAQTVPIFNVNDPDVGGDPAFSVRPFTDLDGLPGIHVPTFSSGLTGMFIWASGQIGTGAGITRLSNVGVTAARTFTFPNVSGTALVVAGTVTRTNSTSAVTSTLIAATVAGAYQTNLVVSNGSTAGNRVLSVTLNWTDDIGSRTAPLVVGRTLDSTTEAAENFVYTVRTAASTAITLTYTLTGTTGTYNLTSSVTKL